LDGNLQGNKKGQIRSHSICPESRSGRIFRCAQEMVKYVDPDGVMTEELKSYAVL